MNMDIAKVQVKLEAEANDKIKEKVQDKTNKSKDDSDNDKAIRGRRHDRQGACLKDL
jgi:hypothetical protein